MGDERVAYLEDGREVLVLGGGAGGWLVRVALEDSETGEPLGYGELKIKKTIYDRPPVEKVDADIAKARGELSAIQVAVIEARREKRQIDAEVAARRSTFEMSPIARGLEATLNGTAWWVIEHVYGRPTAVQCSTLKFGSEQQRDGRVVSRLEQRLEHDGIRLTWTIQSTGFHGDKVGVFTTEADAQEEVRRRIHEVMAQNHRVADASLLAHAMAVGVDPLPGYAERVAAVLKMRAEEEVNAAKAALAKAEAKLAALAARPDTERSKADP